MNTPLYIARRMKGDAGRSGRAGRLTTRIAAVSVAVSIVVMLVAVAVVRGFRSEIINKAEGFSGQILMEAPGAGFMTESYPISKQLSYFDSLKALPYIERVQCFATRAGLIKTESAIEGCILKGVDKDYNWNFYSSCLVSGSLPDVNTKSPSNDIIISKRMSDRLSLSTGDPLVMYFIDENVRVRKFKICGVYDAQFEDVDNHLVLGDIRHSQRLNDWTVDEVAGMEIFLSSKHRPKQPVDAIESFIVSNSTDQDDGVVLRSLRSRYSHLFDWLDLLDLNVVIILVLMVLVAGFNMISGLLIMIFEKTSMIGTLKAMGMNNRDIGTCFMFRSAVIVFKGVIWGTVIGISLCLIQKQWNIVTLNPDNYFVDKVPIVLSVWNVLAVDILGPLAIMACLLLPLMIVSRISPARSIRVR